jgi:hypothetical protein
MSFFLQSELSGLAQKQLFNPYPIEVGYVPNSASHDVNLSVIFGEIVSSFWGNQEKLDLAVSISSNFSKADAQDLIVSGRVVLKAGVLPPVLSLSKKRSATGQAQPISERSIGVS